MSNKSKKLKQRVLALSLSAIMIATVFGGVVDYNLTVKAESTSDKIEAATKERDALAEKLKQAKADREALDKQKDEAQSELSFLAERSVAQNQLYEEAVQKREAALANADSALLTFQMAMDNFQKKSDEYAKRITTMSRVQQKSALEIFLSSGSLDGFFTTMQIMRYVNDADEKALLSLQESEKLAEASKEQADQLAGEAKQVVDECAEIIEQIKNDTLKAEETLATYTERLKRVASDADTIEAKKQEAEAEISKLKVAAATNPVVYNPYNGGAFTWPVPGAYTITSPFGYRWHPVFGGGRFHDGIDIGASHGRSVVAAVGGVVTRASYNGGYGNLVTLNHGNGLVTMYAHLSGYNVGVGDTVNAGDCVGFIGSTGWSTGPHLHFQVEVNGTAVNPMLYLN